MTLGRTSSGSIKIKADTAGGGLRAVNCECCGGCEPNPYDWSEFPTATANEYAEWLRGGTVEISMSFSGYFDSYSDSATIIVPPLSCSAVTWDSFEPTCYWDALGFQFLRGVSLTFGIIDTVDWGYRVVGMGSGGGALTLPSPDGTGNECVGEGAAINTYDSGTGQVEILGKIFYYDYTGFLSAAFNFTPNE